MLRIGLRVVLVVVSAFLPLACSQAPDVVQGTVVSYDPTTKLLVLRDEAKPQVLQLSLAGAEVGAEPTTGDMVRIAYHERDGGRVATRVMNVSRQEEIGGKARKSSGSH